MRIIIIFLILFTNKGFSFYIDPGTGSYLTQILIASALSILFYLKNIKNYIKGKFRK